MQVSDFDFELPDDLIARYPANARDESRLMVLDRRTGAIDHMIFRDLPSLLRSGDVLVRNVSKVIPARLKLEKESSGGRVEILLVEPIAAKGGDERYLFRAMAKSSKALMPGQVLTLPYDRRRVATVVERQGEGFFVLAFESDPVSQAHDIGELPIPPYLDRPEEPLDRERYQTVYASNLAMGSVAAPTAGLHFTPEVFGRLEQGGVANADLILHVGPGTFLPVRVDDVESHSMHAERYEIPVETVQTIAQARKMGGRVIAVGTTATRALEAVGWPLVAGAGQTQIFIKPGDEFSVIDGLLTNFHLPKSTLLMLVCAWGGTDRVLRAYREAIAGRYRFYSYGDAMLILWDPNACQFWFSAR